MTCRRWRGTARKVACVRSLRQARFSATTRTTPASERLLHVKRDWRSEHEGIQCDLGVGQKKLVGLCSGFAWVCRHGSDPKEVEKMIGEAIEFHIEGLKARSGPIRRLSTEACRVCVGVD